jgi:hypothetical protein
MKQGAGSFAAYCEYEGDKFIRNVGLLSPVYNGLITQKTKLFIITGVRTSNPTRCRTFFFGLSA